MSELKEDVKLEGKLEEKPIEAEKITNDLSGQQIYRLDIYKSRPGMYKAAKQGNSRKAAIRLFCLECVGGKQSDVRHCASQDCILWGFRAAKPGVVAGPDVPEVEDEIDLTDDEGGKPTQANPEVAA
jgi:hypothetical protein